MCSNSTLLGHYQNYSLISKWVNTPDNNCLQVTYILHKESLKSKEKDLITPQECLKIIHSITVLKHLHFQVYNTDNQVPDSAATGTAFLCGTKGNYHTLGLDYSVKKDDCLGSRDPKTWQDSVMKWAQDDGKDTGKELLKSSSGLP